MRRRGRGLRLRCCDAHCKRCRSHRVGARRRGRHGRGSCGNGLRRLVLCDVLPSSCQCRRCCLFAFHHPLLVGCGHFPHHVRLLQLIPRSCFHRRGGLLSSQRHCLRRRRALCRRACLGQRLPRRQLLLKRVGGHGLVWRVKHAVRVRQRLFQLLKVGHGMLFQRLHLRRQAPECSGARGTWIR